MEAESYLDLNRRQRLEGEYGFCPEKGVWLFWRRQGKVDYNVAVTVESGEVVEAEAWTNKSVKSFVEDHTVEIRSETPRYVEEAAMQTRIEDLL